MFQVSFEINLDYSVSLNCEPTVLSLLSSQFSCICQPKQYGASLLRGTINQTAFSQFPLGSPSLVRSVLALLRRSVSIFDDALVDFMPYGEAPSKLRKTLRKSGILNVYMMGLMKEFIYCIILVRFIQITISLPQQLSVSLRKKLIPWNGPQVRKKIEVIKNSVFASLLSFSIELLVFSFILCITLTQMPMYAKQITTRNKENETTVQYHMLLSGTMARSSSIRMDRKTPDKAQMEVINMQYK